MMMKAAKTVIIVLLAVSVVGCGPPREIKNNIYTAELLAQQTLEDAQPLTAQAVAAYQADEDGDGKPDGLADPQWDGTSVEALITQRDYLLMTLYQVHANVETCRDWFRGRTPGTEGGE